MSFERKKQDIFGLTLDDSVWRNQGKPSLQLNGSNDSFEQMLNQDLTLVNNSPVQQSKQDASCFQYGFPSLVELNIIGSFNQKEMKQERSDLEDLEICHVTTIHQEITEEKSIFITDPLQEDEQCHSLFQYDLLFNQKIGKEKSITQSCLCCPPLDLSKSSREIIITKDEDLSYMRPISIKHIPEKSSSCNNLLETMRKTAQSVYPLKDVNNNSVSNKLAGGKLNEQSNSSTPKEKNTRPVTNPLMDLNNNNDFVTTKPADERLDETSGVTKLMDKTVQPISLNGSLLNKSAGGLKEEQSNVSILEEKINPLTDLNNDSTDDESSSMNKPTDKTTQSASLKDSVLNKLVVSRLDNPSNVTIPTEKTVQPVNPLKNTMVKPRLNEQSNFNSKSQPSILTVEKVQSILEFYHSTSEDLTIEKETQENVIYYSDDEKEPEPEPLDDIDFFDISNVKLFKCSQCDKEFPDKNSMRYHTMNDHKYICNICNKVLYHVRHMQRHEEKAHGNYTMYDRKKSKSRGSRQTKRKRNPDTVRSYYCCGQNFKSGREFGIHKSTHKYMRKRNLPY